MGIGTLDALIHGLGPAGHMTHFRGPAHGAENALEALHAEGEATEEHGLDTTVAPHTRDIVEKLFRTESFVTEVAERCETADSYEHVVFGPESVRVNEMQIEVEGNLAERHGERDREAGDHEHSTDKDEIELIAEEVEEEVHGRTIHTAAYSAEGMVAGAYVNVVTGAYLRAAGWVDLMAWGGWIEADTVRMDLALLMVRSHVGYAHASSIRAVAASRLVDDFVLRTENFGLMFDSGLNQTSVGGPGSGIDNSA